MMLEAGGGDEREEERGARGGVRSRRDDSITSHLSLLALTSHSVPLDRRY
jgi:hypothetical protein